jgi:transketolase N-terminal domain/subunit
LHAAGSGHVGGSASAADMLAALYFHILKGAFPFSRSPCERRDLAELKAKQS